MSLQPLSTFGRAEDDQEQFYAYHLDGRCVKGDYLLTCIITDFAGKAWHEECSLRDLKAVVEDISPEDKQMLQWIEEAAQHNNFRLKDIDELAFSLLDNQHNASQSLAAQQAALEESQQQVQQLNLQLQQAMSQLDVAHQALKKSKGKTPVKSSQQTATLSTLDNMSPTQSMLMSQDIAACGPAQKKAHYSTQHTAPSAYTSPVGTTVMQRCNASPMPSTQRSNQAQRAAGTSQAASEAALPETQEQSQAPEDHTATTKVGHAKVVARGGRGRGRSRAGRATKIAS